MDKCSDQWGGMNIIVYLHSVGVWKGVQLDGPVKHLDSYIVTHLQEQDHRFILSLDFAIQFL